MRSRAWIVLPLVTACSAGRSPPAVQTDSKAPAITADEAAVHSILDRYCARCHDRTLSTAKPAALAVFDLEDADWTARMTDAQLRESAVRLAGTRGPTSDTPATPSEVATLRAVIERRLERRASKN
jgi:hypothetical protein